ncbi:protein-disulfide reductase DsbD [Vibrio sp.]|nr:protein-disulfide reductase DsbD [Vibrio sp.]
MLRLLFLISLCVFSQIASAAFESNSVSPFNNQSNRFVKVDEAFDFNASQTQDTVHIDWQIKSGYYLYRKSIKINGKDVSLTPLSLPDGLPHEDEFFGHVQIYRDSLFIKQSLSNIGYNSSISITYQGCADAGFCYPPESRTITLSPTSDAATPQINLSQQDQIAGQLSSDNWTLLLLFILGIGLAFTPCVLPMYPILTSLVFGQKELTKSKALTLSFIYVQGMALTYTILGLIVASAGLQFQAYLQNPYILVTLSILFILLALSMFGAFSLQLPSSVQTKLNDWSNEQQGGTLWGVFVMGAISGLVCSPCTTAPLSGALLYVSQTGNLYTGALALYLLALGMGVPLIAVAVFGQHVLPRSGAWMDKVKHLFGFVLLTAPLFLLERIIPDYLSKAFWGLLAVCTILWLAKTLLSLKPSIGIKLLVSAILVTGLALSINSFWIGAWKTYQSPHQQALPFVHVSTLSELQNVLAEAKKQNRPVMMDFYADWCVACKEFEKYTFTDERVQRTLADYVLVQADVTANNADDQELLKTLGILGLPTIQFWDQRGETQSQTRVTGFMNADTYLNHLNQLNKKWNKSFTNQVK